MKDNGKFLGMDVIRVVSMFCVIFLHCASNRLRVNMYNTGWSIANMLTAFATCGVPMFFMISGALILNSKNTLRVKYTLKNRILRLMIPMIVWSCIAVLARLYTDERTAVTAGNFYNEMLNFFNRPVAVHLWFMYYLIPMYLISPALKAFTDNSSKNIVRYIIILWLLHILSLTLSGILKEDSQKLMVSVSFINNIGFISGYLGYFILGWYLFNNKTEISSVWLIIIALCSVVFISVGTTAVSRYNEFYTETFKSYRSIFVVMLSSSIFILLNRIERLPRIIVKIVSEISALSYGVYLSHNVIIDVLNRWGLKNHSLKIVFLTFFIASCASLIMMKVLNSFSFTGRVFGGVKK
ncbi:MAG: acyltransferase family protein [Clostridia bacterium]|nr:acyltransferase family protein [Clostridia bacterium]